MKLKPIIKNYEFLFYFILVTIATYLDFGALALAIFFLTQIARQLQDNRSTVLNKSTKLFGMFVFYYCVVSVYGLIIGAVSLKYFLEFILKYIAVPFTCFKLFPKNEKGIDSLIKAFQVLIVICALYGVIEQIIQYNYLVEFVRIDAKSFIESMNNKLLYNVAVSYYKPSSLFLHYTYYGCVLSCGLLFSVTHPFNNKMVNLAIRSLFCEQVLACQSRIAWVSIAVILFIHLFRKRKITSKMARSFLVVLASLVVVIILSPAMFQDLWSYIYKRFEVLAANGMSDGSLGQRAGTLFNWPKYFSDNMFRAIIGTGYRSNEIVYLPKYSYIRGVSTTDCMYTILLVDTGIVGIMLFFISYIRSFIIIKGLSEKKLLQYLFILFSIEFITFDISAFNTILLLLYFMLALFGSAYSINKKR